MQLGAQASIDLERQQVELAATRAIGVEERDLEALPRTSQGLPKDFLGPPGTSQDFLGPPGTS